MDQNPESFQNQPLSDLEKRRIESETAKNEAERIKFTLEAEEVRRRLSQKWYSGGFLIKLVVGGIVLSALIANWAIFYFAPMLQTKQINAELNNAKLAKENWTQTQINEQQRQENEEQKKINEQQRKENEGISKNLSEIQVGYKALSNSYDSSLKKLNLSDQERAKLHEQNNALKRDLEQVRRDLMEVGRRVQTIPGQQEPQFKTIRFDSDSYDLNSNARALLDENSKILRDFPNITIRIEGYGDGIIWSRELELDGFDIETLKLEDLVLGEKRARKAKEYLIGQGISSSRITAIAYEGGYLGDSYRNQETHGRCEFVVVRH